MWLEPCFEPVENGQQNFTDAKDEIFVEMYSESITVSVLFPWFQFFVAGM